MPDCNASTEYDAPNPPAKRGGCCLGACDPIYTKLCRHSAPAVDGFFSFADPAGWLSRLLRERRPGVWGFGSRIPACAGQNPILQYSGSRTAASGSSLSC
jgi:hypothetical protein